VLQADEVVEVTQSVWLSLLGEELAPVDDTTETGAMLSGCVQLSGAFEGAVSVDCAAPLARTVTGVMFEMEPSKASGEELADAIGEITNMIGGNIKALLPGPSVLSLPTVTREPGGLTVPGTTPMLVQSFRYGEQTMTVTVLTRALARRRDFREKEKE
jgi:chemotaxis protein CheX